MEAASMVEIPTRWKYAECFIHGSLAQLGSATGFYEVCRIIRRKSLHIGIVVFMGYLLSLSCFYELLSSKIPVGQGFESLMTRIFKNQPYS